MHKDQEERSNKEFSQAFDELMRERYGDADGKYDLSVVFNHVEGYSYEALRLMLRGRRRLTMEALEGVADAIGISPHYFREYRLMWVCARGGLSLPLGDSLYEVARDFVERHERGEEFKAGPAETTS